MATDQVLRAAIIGTGRIADLYDDETVHIPGVSLPQDIVHANMYNVKPVSHAGAYRSVAGYELVAAANRGSERLQDFGRRHGVQALYTDYRKMLAEERPDVVSICTQSTEKHEVVLACAEAGVTAVIVEKAFATSLAEADAILAACERSGTFVAVNHPRRFSLMYRRQREIALSGTIGELGTIVCYSGSLLHLGTHSFDYMRFVGGEVTSVLAEIPGIESKGDPNSSTYPDLKGDAFLTFADGARGVFVGVAPHPGGTEIRGSQGYITTPTNTGVMQLVQSRQKPASEYGISDIPGSRPVRPVLWEEAVPAWPERTQADECSSTQRLLKELYSTLTTGAPFISTGRDGAAALELGIACYYSALSGGPVSLPLVDRELRVLNR